MFICNNKVHNNLFSLAYLRETPNFYTDNSKRKKESRLYRTVWVIFCIIGVHILNIIITHLQMNSNFTSCQKESNEFLHEDFTKSKSPDILLRVQPRTLHKIGCLFFTPHHTLSLHSDHFHKASFQVGTQKRVESLYWKYLRFIFKFSWNL